MSALFMFGVIFIAVVAMIIAISKFNIHPFIRDGRRRDCDGARLRLRRG